MTGTRPSAKTYEIRNIITLTELGNVGTIRFTQMPYRVWNEPYAMKIDRGEFWFDWEKDKWIQTKPPTYASISYLSAKEKVRQGIKLSEYLVDEPKTREGKFIKSVSSLNRAKQRVNSLVRLNFGPGDMFLTLTFKENLTDIKKANKYFNLFNMRFNKYLKLQGVEYKWLLVYEYQKRGAVHFHIILKNVTDMKLRKITTYKYKNGKNLGIHDVYSSEIIEKFWPYGFNTCLKIKNCDFSDENTIGRLASYMSKYITKMFYDNSTENSEVTKYTKECKMKNINDYKARLYRTSKNLKRPVMKKIVTQKEYDPALIMEELFQKKIYGGLKKKIKVKDSEGNIHVLGFSINYEFDIESARLIFEYLCDLENLKNQNTFVDNQNYTDLKIRGFVENGTVTFSDDYLKDMRVFKKAYANKGGMVRRRYYFKRELEKAKFQNQRLLDRVNITLTN